MSLARVGIADIICFALILATFFVAPKILLLAMKAEPPTIGSSWMTITRQSLRIFGIAVTYILTILVVVVSTFYLLFHAFQNTHH